MNGDGEGRDVKRRGRKRRKISRESRIRIKRTRRYHKQDDKKGEQI